MSYLDGLIDPCFKPKDVETVIFFPYGAVSKGYLVSKDDEQRIRKFLRQLYIVSFGLTLPLIAAVGVYALATLVILLPWYAIKIRRFLKGKEKTRERSSMHYTITTMTTSSGLPT